MKRGLGQVDLNLRARLALLELIEEPERQIAELLKSPQPIDRETRLVIAQALTGSYDGLHLSTSNSKNLGKLKALRNRVRRLRLGKLARQRPVEVGYDETISELATLIGGVGLKTAERCYKDAGPLIEREESVRKDYLWFAEYDPEIFVVAFAYADLQKTEPTAELAGPIKGVSGLLDRVDQLIAEVGQPISASSFR